MTDTTTTPVTSEDWIEFLRGINPEKPKPAPDSNPANPYLTAPAPTPVEPEVIDGHDEVGERVLDTDGKAQLGDLIDQYAALDEAIKDAKARMDAVRADIEAILGDHEFKDADSFSAKVSYTFPTPRKTLDKKAFEEQHPLLVEEYNAVAAPFYREGKRTSRLSITAK